MTAYTHGERLQKFLAECGLGSRRKCELLIQSGNILVNGKPAILGQSVDAEKDTVTYRGKRIQPAGSCYILLNKPKGCLSTVSDPQQRNTILDLVKMKGRVYPVGRLDKNSEGLILLTNDGELAYRLTHPKFQVEKVYDVRVKGVPSSDVLLRVRNGVMLEDGITSSCGVRIKEMSKGKENCLLELKLHEGRKREIRRMMEAVGHPVISLLRIAIGPLRLSGVSSGKWRMLTQKEIHLLKNLAKNNV